MNFSLAFQRIVKYGFLNLWRNRWLTVSAISVMAITLLVISSLLVVNQLVSLSAESLQSRVDISVFFESDTSVETLNKAKAEFEKMEEVNTVRLITVEEALEDFKRRHADDELIQQTLEELETNPLQPSLVITAKSLDQYPVIFQKLQRSRFNPLFAKINYEDNRDLIDTLKKITTGLKLFGVALTVIFSFVAGLVMFNTLRLTILNRKDEIEIMRLVGAPNSYIQGPFLVEGVVYGVVATLLASLVLYPLMRSLAPWVTTFFGLDVLSTNSYFSTGFWQIAVIQLGVGVGLGVVSSIIATKKYLRR